MKISVIGCGYLGAVHASSLAKLGHEVVGIDIDAAKVALLSSAHAPFYEPGLPELLAETLAAGTLSFSTDMSLAEGATVHFIAVGTPQQADSNAADLRFVEAAFDAIIPHLSVGDVVVGKSTVPVGTAERLALRIEAVGAHLAWNPEFLREGYAVKDTISPDRLVYGVRPEDTHSVLALDEVYASVLAQNIPRVVTDYATSELVKVAANAFLATKISFINAMAEVAEVTGADVTQLADAIGYDQRIGRRFLNAGLGFGGGCLPKDIRAFMARASELGAGDALSFLGEVDAINLRRRERMVDLCREVLGGTIEGARVAVLGLAFKPDSDDVRDSPALDVAARLAELGAHVRATDPQAIETSRRLRPGLDYVTTVEEAAKDADVVLVLTEWREYRAIDPSTLDSIVSVRAILDGRNCLDPVQWREAGWTYRALGRP
ncbi:UDP-glucose/GDP-mannose dehydrogenase family protein [Salinibacterium sp. SWN139]|uniref:UDP-glucose dehydrogenase family protein n=1 Tax=Salinibacterium sp. SWN139 TaxID=2792055 RepID=UPI0018CC83EF|nr:UDP-glucose/GDP-mannose dehydrogenase family protein [Salinibacterium sp. SWN139]MBH0053549.1 UDP-glucose/GDP-mannose dehydrogenase family protein [Salinibacterium sp. SWN139]